MRHSTFTEVCTCSLVPTSMEKALATEGPDWKPSSRSHPAARSTRAVVAARIVVVRNMLTHPSGHTHSYTQGERPLCLAIQTPGWKRLGAECPIFLPPL